MKAFLLLLSILIASTNLLGQNIGINKSDPEEIIHMQNDTHNVVLRFDNRKSSKTGTVDTTIICSPSNLAQIFSPAGIEWQTLNITDLQQSDDIYTTSGTLMAGEHTRKLRVTFNCDNNIPLDATINTIDLDTELSFVHNDPLSVGSVSTFGWAYNGPVPQNLFLLGLLAPFSVDQTLSFLVANTGDFTPADINSEQFKIQYNFDPSGADLNVLIDFMEIQVNYTIPALGTEEVRWTAGVQNGKFNISKSKNITNNQYVSITESGLTRLKSLQITDNADNGKILSSSIDGTAMWRFPYELGIGQGLIWFQVNDTVIYDQGPVKIDNPDDVALSFHNGRTLLQNHDNMLSTKNAKVNFLIDTENGSNDDAFSIYKNKDDASDAAIIKFHLEGQSSWINSGDLGLKTNNPNTDLHLVHGPASESDGFKIQQQGTTEFWRMHTSAGGQLLLFNTGSPIAPIGSFSPINGAYTALSDERLKKNIRSLSPVMASLREISPVRYGFKHWEGEEASIGFLAQDVIKYFPEVVTYHKDLDRYTMDYSAFGVLAIQAIKELDERITKLEKLVAEMNVKQKSF